MGVAARTCPFASSTCACALGSSAETGSGAWEAAIAGCYGCPPSWSRAARLDQVSLTTESDDCRRSGHRIDLASKPMYENLDDSRSAVVGGVPAVFEQFCLGYDAALAAHEIFQDRELAIGEFDRSPVSPDGTAGRIQRQAGGGEHGRPFRQPAPCQ